MGLLFSCWLKFICVGFRCILVMLFRCRFLVLIIRLCSFCRLVILLIGWMCMCWLLLLICLVEIEKFSVCRWLLRLLMFRLCVVRWLGLIVILILLGGVLEILMWVMLGMCFRCCLNLWLSMLYVLVRFEVLVRCIFNIGLLLLDYLNML